MIVFTVGSTGCNGADWRKCDSSLGLKNQHRCDIFIHYLNMLEIIQNVGKKGKEGSHVDKHFVTTAKSR